MWCVDSLEDYFPETGGGEANCSRQLLASNTALPGPPFKGAVHDICLGKWIIYRGLAGGEDTSLFRLVLPVQLLKHGTSRASTQNCGSSRMGSP